MKNILLITILVFLSACAKDSNDTNADVAQVPNPTINNEQNSHPVAPNRPPYGYNYQDPNCTTGPQRFRSHSQYCDGLRNENRNNRCAVQSRYNDFRNHCPGRRWQR